MNILLIEDEGSLRKAFVGVLRSKGYKVVDIPDVSDNKLENALEGEHIDAIISGVMQPYKDGLTVLKELKADDRYKNIPYIIASNLSAENVKQEAFRLGAQLYIVNTQETIDSWGMRIDEFMKKLYDRSL